MAQRSGRSVDQSSVGPDINYSNFQPELQSCSMFTSSQDEASAHATTVLASSENANGTFDKKPALPPKPAHGPPLYREPPSPPDLEEANQHPDICINSKPLRAAPKLYTSEVFVIERPDKLGSRTHAWIQEHKTSGKLVGEKLSSLQRKLRSLLTQSSSKDSSDIEKSMSLERKPAMHDTWNFHSSSDELSIKPKSAFSSCNMPATSSSQEQHLSVIAPPSHPVPLTSAHYSSHNHPYKSYFSDRHPFGASVNHEQEDSADPDQLRDTCNKFFSREQRISWTNYLSPRNCYSNNIKSSYDYDKLVPKEVIGRPNEKKPEPSSNCDSIYGVAPFPSFSKPHDMHVRQSESQPTETYDGSYFARRVQNFAAETSLENSLPCESQVPSKDNEAPPDSLPCGTSDCADITDLYKSSSESGRGTMHSSMHGSKSVVSPHSSGVSAASNLDTSIDSDHSINGTLWDQQNHSIENKSFSEEFERNQNRHIYETPNSSLNCRPPTEKSDGHDEDEISESLSETPPLPPLSPAPSPPVSENSPKLASRAKYKLSLSASALNSSYNKPNDHQQKVSEMSTAKASGKKSGVRRTSSINQSTCRHRSGKSYQCNKGSSSGHRLGIVHSCTSKKCSSPPTRHQTRNQIAFPSYLDNGDPELTSTTTGLDMESLLDEADEYSSDISATASTMEPNEVNMIRKQLEGLETMYSEILRLLGVKNSCKDTMYGSLFDVSHHSHRRVNESLSSLTGRSSISRGTHNFTDKRGYTEKRRLKSDCRFSSASKRLQRLESHVVTLARSVAHLSSEMRTQHVLVQELENMRQDVSWVQERMRLMQLAQGCHSSSGTNRNHQLAMPRDWDNFHREVLELLNPCRAKKLTKFFGDEPPLIRQFLKRLGYEKYATNFETEKIGIKELPYLTEERLQKMGIPMGPRIRILQEAHACCQQNQYKVYIV